MKRRGNLYAAILAGALSLFPVATVPAEGTGRTAGTTAGASSAADNAAGTTAAGPAAEQDGKRPRRLTHRIGAEFRPEHIFTINPFLRGENLAQLPDDLSLAAH